jgi:hypothetical protein
MLKSFLSPLYFCHPTNKPWIATILLPLLSKYFQKTNTSYYLHCSPVCLNQHHFSHSAIFWILNVSQRPIFEALIFWMVLLGDSETFKRWGLAGSLYLVCTLKGDCGILAPFSFSSWLFASWPWGEWFCLPPTLCYKCCLSGPKQPVQLIMDWNFRSCEPK